MEGEGPNLMDLSPSCNDCGHQMFRRAEIGRDLAKGKKKTLAAVRAAATVGSFVFLPQLPGRRLHTSFTVALEGRRVCKITPSAGKVLV